MKMPTKEISTQAKNDVKELLGEYVVSPLNKDISNVEFKVDKSIGELNQEIISIKNTLKPISRYLDYLINKLNQSFHFEDDEDVFENLVDTLDLDSKFEEVKKCVCSDIKSIEKLLDELEQKILNGSKDLNSDIEKLKTDISQISERVQYIQNVLEDNKSFHQKEVSRILEKTEEISNLQSENYKEIKKILQEMKSSIVSEVDQKHKSLIASLITINVLELLGIAVLILYFFL